MKRVSIAASGTREDPKQRLGPEVARVCFWGAWGQKRMSSQRGKQWALV